MDAEELPQAPQRRLQNERKSRRIRARQHRPLWLRIAQEVGWIMVCVLIVVLLRLFVFGAYEIPSASMESTLNIGDRIVASKIQPKVSGVQRGDIVIFHDPDHWLNNGPHDDYLIKRVIGVAGDEISADGTGPVKLNGKVLDEVSYIKKGTNSSARPFTVKVKTGYVFVMGDNRPDSADSRFHMSDRNGGQVPLAKIEAIANATYWPLNRIGLLRRPDSVFQGQ